MRVNFGWITGKTLTFSVYTEAGSARETGTSLTETPASSGLYLGTATLLVPGDNVVIKEGSVIVGHGQFDIEIALETTIADDNPDGSSVDQTFTLAEGATYNDEYFNMVVSVTDVSSGVTSSQRAIAYVGSTKKITVDVPYEFALAIGDIVRIWADTYSQTADAAAVADIVDAVHDEDLISAHDTPGSAGYHIRRTKGRY
jgi:hypothetical protein